MRADRSSLFPSELLGERGEEESEKNTQSQKKFNLLEWLEYSFAFYEINFEGFKKQQDG